MRGSGHTGQQKWIPAAARGAGQQNPLDLPMLGAPGTEAPTHFLFDSIDIPTAVASSAAPAALRPRRRNIASPTEASPELIQPIFGSPAIRPAPTTAREARKPLPSALGAGSAGAGSAGAGAGPRSAATGPPTTWSATQARRNPIGCGAPPVVSRAVWCSSSELSSAPNSRI